MNAEPLFLYVPGLRAKPPPRTYARELFRCLVEGVHRIDPEAAARIREHETCLDIAGWTYDFYGEHRDIGPDLPGIEGVLAQREASSRDIAEARSFRRRAVRWLYRIADSLPFLIPQIADEKVQLHLQDLRRYVRNEFDVAETIRRLVKLPLRAAAAAGRPIMLIGHSMGSVIAFDALWQMSRVSEEAVTVDLFLTLGSPLGQRYIQKRLQGANEPGERRWPSNIRRWINIAAVGELTAIDMQLRNDFSDMVRRDLVEDIRDFAIFNYFRTNGDLNVHAEYGYLVNTVTARQILEWWRSL